MIPHTYTYKLLLGEMLYISGCYVSSEIGGNIQKYLVKQQFVTLNADTICKFISMYKNNT